MRRAIVLITVLLIGGAIVNVAVAWGCAVLVPPAGSHLHIVTGWHAPSEPAMQQRGLDWIVERAEAFGTTRLRANPMRSDRSGRKGPEASAISPYWSAYPALLYDRSDTGLNMNANGWPLRCLLYRWKVQGSFGKDGKPNPLTIKFVNGIGLSDFKHPAPGINVSHVRGLPLEPIRPGFAINTIFYAALLWLLFLAPGKVRRTIRRRRGLCPTCAYPIGTSPVCTECGAAITRINKQ